jgi:chemotaxis-related protein WspB
MNVVVWRAAGQKYATPTRQVVEVISLVETRPLRHLPDWVAGLINYRGRLIELFDMSRRLGQAGGEPRMASRIVVVQAGATEPDDDRLLGLLVEEVFGSQDLDFAHRPDPAGLSSDDVAFLGPIAVTGQSTVQLVDPSRLVAPRAT